MSVNNSDDMVFLGKSLLGAVPFVGPFLSEVVSATIPNQRIDRLESFAKILEERLSDHEKVLMQSRFNSSEATDLLEDSFIQASRALSEERKHYIAALLSNSLISDEIKYVEGKRLLQILSGLTDIEILMLVSQKNDYDGSDAFWEKHKDVLQSPSADLGSDRDELDRHAIFQTHNQHLVSVGLLKPRFIVPMRGQDPQFDPKTGMMKTSGFEITPLGRLLIRRLDISI